MQWRRLEERGGARRLARRACGGAKAALTRHLRSALFSLALPACCGCCAQYSCAGTQRQHQKLCQCTYRPDRRAAARRCRRCGARERLAAMARLQRAAEDVHAAHAAQPGEPTATQSESGAGRLCAWAQRAQRGPQHAQRGALQRRSVSAARVRRRAARCLGRHRLAPSPRKSESGAQGRSGHAQRCDADLRKVDGPFAVVAHCHKQRGRRPEK